MGTFSDSARPLKRPESQGASDPRYTGVVAGQVFTDWTMKRRYRNMARLAGSRTVSRRIQKLTSARPWSKFCRSGKKAWLVGAWTDSAWETRFHSPDAYKRDPQCQMKSSRLPRRMALREQDRTLTELLYTVRTSDEPPKASGVETSRSRDFLRQ